LVQLQAPGLPNVSPNAIIDAAVRALFKHVPSKYFLWNAGAAVRAFIKHVQSRVVFHFIRS
jgi:hypothetical protein